MSTAKPDRFCPDCKGTGITPARLRLSGLIWYPPECTTCDGTGKRPSIEAKPPLASVDAAPAAPDAGPTPITDKLCYGFGIILAHAPDMAYFVTKYPAIIKPVQDMERELAAARAELSEAKDSYFEEQENADKRAEEYAELETKLAAARAELAGYRDVRLPRMLRVAERAQRQLAEDEVKLKAAEQELAEWKRNAEEYSQEAKDELDRRLAAEQEAERLRGEVAAAVALLGHIAKDLECSQVWDNATWQDMGGYLGEITAFLSELKGQKL